MSLVNGNLMYGLLLWGPMAQASDMKKLLRLQKKAIRHINSSVYNAPTKPICKKYKILKLDDLIQLELAKFMYKFTKRELPDPLLGLFQTGSQFHNYSTRGRDYAVMPKNKKEIINKSFLCRGPATWATLSTELRNSISLDSFANKLKKSLSEV